MLAQIKGTAKVISIHAPARGATGQSDSVRAVVRISIHAPARGATRRNGRGLPEETISIHAPARGATTDGILLSSSNLFQSTLPRGERLSQLTYQRGGFRFQSTLPRGERQRVKCKDAAKELFQSTLPRGERLVYGFKA